ncbi:hypothetical protein BKA57DRAFT_473448 [Linnemannia elongata]|nr:hypothetical protein BKA57DRAFT_473448 [Linnemannia elongata]
MLWYMVHGREQWFFFCHRSASTLFFDKLNSSFSSSLFALFYLFCCRFLFSLLVCLFSFSIFLFTLMVYLFVCLSLFSLISLSLPFSLSYARAWTVRLQNDSLERMEQIFQMNRKRK